MSRSRVRARRRGWELRRRWLERLRDLALSLVDWSPDEYRPWVASVARAAATALVVIDEQRTQFRSDRYPIDWSFETDAYRDLRQMRMDASGVDTLEQRANYLRLFDFGPSTYSEDIVLALLPPTRSAIVRATSQVGQ